MNHSFRRHLRTASWVPTLYFIEGVPYFIVNNISVMLFTRMGVPNGEMALFTSLLYLPWTIKPLWSPMVDVVGTKRRWIILTQMLMAAALMLLAFTLPHPAAADIAAKGVSISMFTFTLVLFIITALASATHDIAADGFYIIATESDEQSFYMGVRSTAYRLAGIFTQGLLVYVAGTLETSMGDIPMAWKMTLGGAGVVTALFALYHTFIIPRPQRDGAPLPDANAAKGEEEKGKWAAMAEVFTTFFSKPGVGMAIAFMLVFRLPEAFLLKMINPFMVDPIERGGLAISTQEYGFIYGTIGVLALVVGGLLGGYYASRVGLRRSIVPMALALALPCCAFLGLALWHPHSLWVIGACVAIDQFGYGFGFTAYMLYMIRFSEGRYATSHYSLCTAFMALSMMLPGMVAGYIEEAIGYVGFFTLVAVCCVGTILITAQAKRKLTD